MQPAACEMFQQSRLGIIFKCQISHLGFQNLSLEETFSSILQKLCFAFRVALSTLMSLRTFTQEHSNTKLGKACRVKLCQGD